VRIQVAGTASCLRSFAKFGLPAGIDIPRRHHPSVSDQASHAPKQQGIAFLGLCDRVSYVREGNTNVFTWNILGLRNVIFSYIFPISLDGWSIGFALRWGQAETGARLRIRDELGTELGTLNLSGKPASPHDKNAAFKSDAPLLLAPEHGWTVAFLPLTGLGWVISKPGIYYLEHLQAEISVKIGTIGFVVADPLPLTPDRITAIKSEPRAAKSVRIELGCKHCSSKFRAYAALEKNDELEREGWLWYRDAPEQFVCTCGKTIMDLQSISHNLHGLLGQNMLVSDQFDFVPLYQSAALRSTRTNFANLVSKNPAEEVLQRFITANPILLHQFPSTRIIIKPKILTLFVADFGIVTPTKELLLIELEKSDTRLLNRGGGIAAPLNHAFDQVRDWLHEIDEHRLAALDSLKIDRDEVSGIRGVVVAGRDAGYDAKDLRKLKGADRGRVTLLTYDDLIFALDALIQRVERL
jgi:Domain of unknown function (DUF4263)